MSLGNVLLGIVAGIAVGATLGVLFAPDKGSNTRKKITEKGNELAGDLEQKFSELIESITSRLESLQEEAIRLVENGEPQPEEMEKEVTPS
ncbi:MAG: YtxH domain-containing protein [Saprospirales bacterium]|jgi:gas vesicle protein|nr:YtxH domain-containing protein [Saprospirales bacterium]MBK6902810.1 YtxH domain-containing protein [Saprospirales bacterium]MBK7337039.1 YtxH domain-containing protein [Saprospirales bacterium]